MLMRAGVAHNAASDPPQRSEKEGNVPVVLTLSSLCIGPNVCRQCLRRCGGGAPRYVALLYLAVCEDGLIQGEDRLVQGRQVGIGVPSGDVSLSSTLGRTVAPAQARLRTLRRVCFSTA